MLSYGFWAVLVLVGLLGWKEWSLSRVVESARELWAVLTETKAKKSESKPQEGVRGEEEKKAA